MPFHPKRTTSRQCIVWSAPSTEQQYSGQGQTERSGQSRLYGVLTPAAGLIGPSCFIRGRDRLRGRRGRPTQTASLELPPRESRWRLRRRPAVALALRLTPCQAWPSVVVCPRRSAVQSRRPVPTSPTWRACSLPLEAQLQPLRGPDWHHVKAGHGRVQTAKVGRCAQAVRRNTVGIAARSPRPRPDTVGRAAPRTTFRLIRATESAAAPFQQGG